MSLATQRANIKTALEAVSGIGAVKDHVVWTDDWEFIFNNFTDSTGQRVHVWFIGLGSSPAPVAMTRDIRTRTYVWNLIGYYSLKTSAESSKAFEDVVDAILAKFDQETHIGAAQQIAPPSLVGISNVVFTQHGCHTAQIQITVTERAAQAGPCS